MRLIAIFSFIVSCASIGHPPYPNSLDALQKCWTSKNTECIKTQFGSPNRVTKDSFVYLSGENEFLTIFTSKNHQQIEGIQYWIFSSPQATSFEVKKALSSSDWTQSKLPEKNPHAVNLAIANYSAKLGVHFLTYELDKKQEVRVLYWGGNPMDIEL